MKTTRTGLFLIVAVLAGLLSASLAIGQKNDQAEVLLQAANHKQLVEGQLEEAIQLYQRVVREFANNRALAAKALVQMGQCYEKLGNAEARKAYERVLREYADQPEVEEARKRLAALGQPSGSGNRSEMITRRVWAGLGWLTFGNPSSDGRYLSYTYEGTSGDLLLHDFATGKTRPLLTGAADGSAFFSAISPDGKEVAYTWFGKGGTDLRLVRLDGSASRILYSGKAVVGWPTWSPDGKSLLGILINLADPSRMTPQIAVVSVADGSVRVLKTLDWGFPGKMWFSPDGRYIAYDRPPRQDSDNRDVFLLSAQGGREVPLVEHPADDVLLGWTPGGNHVLFASDRSGTMSAWLIRVVDGKPQGSPELVKWNIGQAVPLGFTRAGSYYYGLVIGAHDIYTAEFDPATGRVVREPQKATQRFVGFNDAPAWSPDGQFLAYRSSRPGPQVVIGYAPEVISIRSLKTGEERDLPPNLMESWGPIQWSLDGRSLFVTGKDKKLRHGVFRIDVQTGEVTPALQPDAGSEIARPAWLPDGKRLLYLNWRQDSGTTSPTILLRDLDTGHTTELFRPATGVTIDDLALAPDGQQVALTLLEKETRSSVLKVFPLAGGDARELVRAKEPEAVVGESLSWSADSRYIIFGKGRGVGQERKTELLAIPSLGGEPHPLGLAMDFVHHVSFHPDGRHLAFTSAGKDKVEIWVMENFLPALKAAK